MARISPPSRCMWIAHRMCPISSQGAYPMDLPSCYWWFREQDVVPEWEKAQSRRAVWIDVWTKLSIPMSRSSRVSVQHTLLSLSKVTPGCPRSFPLLVGSQSQHIFLRYYGRSVLAIRRRDEEPYWRCSHHLGPKIRCRVREGLWTSVLKNKRKDLQW